MDKFDLVLDIIGNPEKYSAGKLEEILSDPETREIYNLLCETVSSAKEPEAVDIDRQWQSFTRRHIQKPRRMFWFGSRAASIAVFLVSSLVAVAIGIAVTVSLTHSDRENAVVEIENPAISAAGSVTADTLAAVKDTVAVVTAPVLFEDATLQTIMDEVAKAYKVEVSFNNSAAAGLHLYYKLDPALPLDEIIGQLNTFEQINITRKGNSLIID